MCTFFSQVHLSIPGSCEWWALPKYMVMWPKLSTVCGNKGATHLTPLSVLHSTLVALVAKAVKFILNHVSLSLFHQHQQDWSHLISSPLPLSPHPWLPQCTPSAKWPPRFQKRPPLTSWQSLTKLQARSRTPKLPPARVRELASSCFHCSVSTCPQMARKQNREGLVWSQIAHCWSHDIAENDSLSFPDAAWCLFNPPRVVSCAGFFVCVMFPGNDFPPAAKHKARQGLLACLCAHTSYPLVLV